MRQYTYIDPSSNFVFYEILWSSNFLGLQVVGSYFLIYGISRYLPGRFTKKSRMVALLMTEIFNFTIKEKNEF